MAAASLQLSTPLVWVGCVVVWGPVGGRDACVCSFVDLCCWLVCLASVGCLASARGTGLVCLCFDR